MKKIRPTSRSCRSFGAAVLLVSLFVAAESRAEDAPPAPAKAAKSDPPKQTGIDLSASLGGAIRLGDAPLFDVTQRAGGTVGLGLAYLLHPISIGLAYEHTGLGREESGVMPFGAVKIARSTDTVWASLRVRLSGLEPIVPFLGAGLGAVWQGAHADGVFFSGGARSGQTFSCSAGDSMNLAMRVGAGVEVPFGGALKFVGEGSFDAYRLSSDVLESCAPGAGTTSAILLRVGLVYRFDLGESRKRSALPPPPAASYVR